MNMKKTSFSLVIAILLVTIATIIVFLNLIEVMKNKYIPIICYSIILIGTTFIFYKSKGNKL